MNDSSSVLTLATRQLLKPLVRILLRNGIAFDALNELLKKLYVDMAEEEFSIPRKKQSISRISTLTGLNRKEVSRARAMQEPDLSNMTQQYNRAARVISGWTRDTEFQDSNGNPASLMLDKGKNGFKALVKRYSGDIPAGAIADELLRVGAIEQTAEGKVRLLNRAYIPEKNLNEKIRILGTDVSDLINTIDHNVFVDPDVPYFQRKVAYDAIHKNDIDFLREKMNKQAQNCLEDLDQLLSQHDSDSNPRLKNKGHCRIGVGIFYFEDSNHHEDS